jgi:hypothetical protein
MAAFLKWEEFPSVISTDMPMGVSFKAMDAQGLISHSKAILNPLDG